MQRIIQTIALGAALISIALGIWRDYGSMLALKRALIAYLAAYFLAGLASLAFRAALHAVRDPEPVQEEEEDSAGARRKARRKKAKERRQQAVPEGATATTNEQPELEPAEIG